MKTDVKDKVAKSFGWQTWDSLMQDFWFKGSKGKFNDMPFDLILDELLKHAQFTPSKDAEEAFEEYWKKEFGLLYPDSNISNKHHIKAAFEYAISAGRISQPPIDEAEVCRVIDAWLKKYGKQSQGTSAMELFAALRPYLNIKEVKNG